jgi:hypothetical protein
VAIGIIDRQPFGDSGGVEGLVGRDQCHPAESTPLPLLVDFKRGGQLNGVVSAQRVRIGEPRGVVEQCGRDLDDSVATGEMLAEAVEDRRRPGGCEGPAFPAAGDGGRDFDGRDAGDANGRGWVVARNPANPRGANFVDVTFDESAGIDEVSGYHLSAVRG